MSTTTSRPDQAYIVTGPTSGIGHRTALELARHGTVVLVGRDREKLRSVQAEIEARPGGRAFCVVADFSDVRSVRHAAAEVAALGLPLAGLVNNAGVMLMQDSRRNGQGWDLAFATNHLGPFAFTEALVPHLPDGANVVFVVSAAEDGERKIAVRAGFRGSRFISVEASARGEWQPGGASRPGMDAYATSKQGNLASVFVLAREIPRLRLRAFEPGTNPSTGLARDAGAFLILLSKAMAPLVGHVKYFSTPKRAGRLLAAIATDPSDASGTYYDERGKPMRASTQVSNPEFASRYIAQTRALLATVASA